jgi:lysozyme
MTAFERRATASARAASEPSSDVQAVRLAEILAAAEGRRRDVYLDSLGVPTVGVGHRVVPADGLEVGDVISEARIDALFRQDAARALAAARDQAAAAGVADPGFIAPLAAVNFQLGAGWTADFAKTWSLILAGDYAGAAEEAGRSKWRRQTPKRVAAFQQALRALPPKPGAGEPGRTQLAAAGRPAARA